MCSAVSRFLLFQILLTNLGIQSAAIQQVDVKSSYGYHHQTHTHSFSRRSLLTILDENPRKIEKLFQMVTEMIHFEVVWYGKLMVKGFSSKSPYFLFDTSLHFKGCSCATFQLLPQYKEFSGTNELQNNSRNKCVEKIFSLPLTVSGTFTIKQHTNHLIIMFAVLKCSDYPKAFITFRHEHSFPLFP